MGNPVLRWQIITKDPERHSVFYRDVFGWDISADNALSYRQASSQDGRGIDGGFWPSPGDAPCFVQLFIEVDDVPAAVSRATDHGADVVMNPQHLPEGEVMAILRDCEGLTFSVFNSEGVHK